MFETETVKNTTLTTSYPAAADSDDMSSLSAMISSPTVAKAVEKGYRVNVSYETHDVGYDEDGNTTSELRPNIVLAPPEPPAPAKTVTVSNRSRLPAFTYGVGLGYVWSLYGHQWIDWVYNVLVA